jgi:hypothetical protein
MEAWRSQKWIEANAEALGPRIRQIEDGEVRLVSLAEFADRWKVGELRAMVWLHPDAENEAIEARDRYRRRSGEEFAGFFEKALVDLLRRIEDSPASQFPKCGTIAVETDAGCIPVDVLSAKLPSRFIYSLLFYVRGREPHLLAVQHSNPDYHQGRAR